VRVKLSISIRKELVKKLRKEAAEKNLSLSRLIENKLKEGCK
jgi:predicted HicB family RNase H-like nuclease